MKCLISLILAFIIYCPVVSMADEYSFTFTGYTPGKFYDLEFDMFVPVGAGAYFDVNTGYQHQPNVFVTATSAHFWITERACDAGTLHLIVYTASNKIPTILPPVIQSYVSPDADLYAQLFSFMVGALSSVAFVVAVDTAWKGGTV